MNSWERVIASSRRRQPDRIPFDFALGFSPYQLTVLKEKTGQTNPDEYFHTDTRFVFPSPTLFKSDFFAYHPNLPSNAKIDEWGVGHLPTDSHDAYHSHLEGFLYPMLNLTTANDAREYPLPDIESEYRFEKVPAQVEDQHSRGLCSVGCLACTIFEVAWYMRSMELLLMDFADDAEFATILLDRITEKRCKQAVLTVECGVDILQLGDDISCQRGMLLAANMWRKWLKPRLAKVIAAARAVNPSILICYHTDGDCSAVVPDLIEIGVDILNPVQPECMDPFELKKTYGDSLSVWGCIGTQSVFPFGSPDDVRRAVRSLAETVGRGGGLILAPTHMVEPEVPWDNIVAYVETVMELGGAAK